MSFPSSFSTSLTLEYRTSFPPLRDDRCAHRDECQRNRSLRDGRSSAKEAPYQVHAPTLHRLFPIDALRLPFADATLGLFQSQPPTKRYHYVFGDGQTEMRAVKGRAHSPEPKDRWLSIWKDNDPNDEVAPQVLSCVVYNDEGRGAFPWIQQDYGKLNGEKLVALANRIPIKGGNVENVVYDATAFRLWVSYAKGTKEAFERPYVYIDLKQMDLDQDGQLDLPPDHRGRTTLPKRSKRRRSVRLVEKATIFRKAPIFSLCAKKMAS